ncbi:hypothetical protein NXW86_29800 [Bacteroides thetaiotaomicron]|nr:hypothetical protein [Bacteroides thetaiotaomicron]MCS2453160.1 hypothetical protein [Bacteroides thetaiotaomicron]
MLESTGKFINPYLNENDMDGRRNFLKTAFATCSFASRQQQTSDGMHSHQRAASGREEETFETFATPNALKEDAYQATFLDEISWDIPHQNWEGTKE